MRGKKIRAVYRRKIIGWMLAGTLALAGCASGSGAEEEIVIIEREGEGGGHLQEEASAEGGSDVPAGRENAVAVGEEEESPNENIEGEPEVIEKDWSEYFGGLNGAARGQYMIYNKELAMTQRSPCSTFKIISSLIALENGIIEPGDSPRPWSGETYWNENWNRDIDFYDAFRSSCVWYFREVIDEIGQEMMAGELEELLYGNRDISDWEGRLNTNNNNRALTGFWIESSLKISPLEQAETMERIFGEGSVYSEKTKNELKKVMLVEEENRTDTVIYGKTGMGKANGIVVDAWFTGFAENMEGKVFFCVYLGRTDGGDVSSAAAREIAIRIVPETFFESRSRYGITESGL